MRRRRIGVALIAVLLAVGACTNDDDGASPITVPNDTSSTTSSSTTTTAAPPTTTVEDRIKEQVTEAYQAQWDAFFSIYEEVPNPSDPDISLHYTGVARETLLNNVARAVEQRVAIRRPEKDSDFVPKIEDFLTVDDLAVTFEDCVIDGSVVYVHDTGEVLNDEVSHRRSVVTMELVDNRWKTSSIVTRPTAEDDSECE